MFNKVEYIEEWRPVKNFEGKYEVSSFGRIKSLPRLKINNGTFSTVKGRILTQSKNKNGYKRVALSLNGKSRFYFVHRLVAFSYIEGNCLLDVNHKDGDRANNFYLNLEFCTKSENIRHSLYVTGLKGVIDYKRASEFRRIYLNGGNVAKMANFFGVKKSLVCSVLDGGNWAFNEDPIILNLCKKKYCTGVSNKIKIQSNHILTGEKLFFDSLMDASKLLGVSVSSISKCVKGIRKRASNYSFIKL